MLVLVLIVILAMERIIDSRLGRALSAIREDELAAKSMGINTTRYKITAFAVGAFFAGIAGSFHAHYSSFIDPQSFSFSESTIILAMVVLGGMASIKGSVMGAIILTLLPEALRDFSEYRMIVFGLIMMGVYVDSPSGIWGQTKPCTASIRKIMFKAKGGAIKDAVGG
jgi:branched-chain amino acid transport system permease protein